MVGFFQVRHKAPVSPLFYIVTGISYKEKAVVSKVAHGRDEQVLCRFTSHVKVPLLKGGFFQCPEIPGCDRVNYDCELEPKGRFSESSALRPPPCYTNAANKVST